MSGLRLAMRHLQLDFLIYSARLHLLSAERLVLYEPALPLPSKISVQGVICGRYKALSMPVTYLLHGSFLRVAGLYLIREQAVIDFVF